jgi:hypothetical protein
MPTVTGFGLDDRGSIPCSGTDFFFATGGKAVGA